MSPLADSCRSPRDLRRGLGTADARQRADRLRDRRTETVWAWTDVDPEVKLFALALARLDGDVEAAQRAAQLPSGRETTASGWLLVLGLAERDGDRVQIVSGARYDASRSLL